MANNKYLIIGDKCVTVKIEKTNFLYVKDFHYRLYGGKSKAIEIAREHRDSIHRSKFGHPVGSRFFHSRKKLVKSNSRSHNLPPGIAFGYSRGKKLYIVASWAPSPNKIMRKRFNINEHGLEKAIDLAIDFRNKKISEILDSDQ